MLRDQLIHWKQLLKIKLKICICKQYLCFKCQGGFYKTSKISGKFLRKYNKRDNLNYTILRYGSVISPDSDERNGIKNIKLLKRQINIVWRDLKSEKFLHVKDAVKASEKILKNKFVNRFNYR